MWIKTLAGTVINVDTLHAFWIEKDTVYFGSLENGNVDIPYVIYKNKDYDVCVSMLMRIEDDLREKGILMDIHV